MIKKPIYWKIAGFYHLLKPNSDEKINNLKMGNNTMNYDPCSNDNF